MKITIAGFLFALTLGVGSAHAQVNPGTSPLSGAEGGTNNAFMQFTGPASSIKTFTLPNVSDTIVLLTQSQTLTNKTLTAPILTTPTLGVATGTSLALGGCSVGSNVFCGTGTASIGGSTVINTASATALAVGSAGATNPAFLVNASVASQAAGISVVGNAAGGGAGIAVIDSATNSPLSINAKGSGTINIGSSSTGAVTITPNVTNSGTTTMSGALTYGGVTLSNSVTGTGSMVLATSPALTTPNLGTPSAVTLTNASGLPLSGHTSQNAYTIVANATGSSAAPTAVSIPALTQKVSPAATDKVMIADAAASNALKYVEVSALASAGSVASIAGNTGSFTLSTGITNSGNDIRLSLSNASLLGAPANPTGTSSTGGVMMGLGSTCKITPVYSGRLLVTIDGIVGNNTVGNASTIQVRYGTGTAPANAAALQGTSVGNSMGYGNGGSASNVPFSATRVITGLSAGTQYWLDLVLVASANTSTLTGISCTAVEF